MKINLTIILFFLSFQFYAQCDFLFVVLNSQEDIDDFILNHPDCNDVIGSISIRGPDIVSLEGLRFITSIDGELKISNTSLTNVSGLGNLSSVGWLQIEENDSLQHLDHLNNLDSVHVDLIIKNNQSLSSIHGLSEIKYLNETFWLRENSIDRISGFNNLDKIGSLIISNDKRIKSVSGFNNLMSSTSTITLDGCDSINIISGFNQLKEVGGGFGINGVKVPLELDAFESLEKVDLGFGIRDTYLKETTTLFNGLRSVGIGLSILQCNLEGVDLSFSNLLSVNGRLDITENENEFTIGFNKLRFVEDVIGIHSNPQIKIISGFNNMLAHLTQIEIQGNSSLVEVSGFELLLKCNMAIALRSNYALEKVSGFVSLNETSSLIIYNNVKLKSLSGFSNLEEIEEFLFINLNKMLEELNAFQNLKFIGGVLDIDGCDSLRDISGLSNFDSSEIDEILIEDNPLLSICHIESVCNSIIRPEVVAIIAYNGIGCNSVSEVQSNCETTNVEESQLEHISIFPNPVGSDLTIPHGVFSHYKVIAVDGSFITSGELENASINVSSLSSGVYILCLQSDNTINNYKFVKN